MRFVLAPLPALLAAVAIAQEPQPIDAETYVPITPVFRANPSYPTRALQYGNEGWVMLSFIVSETGAIRNWRYTPATVNGKPVAQSMVKTKIVFALEGPAKGVTREFQGA